MNKTTLWKHLIKTCAVCALSVGIFLSCPGEASAKETAEVQTRSVYMVTIEAPSVDIYQKANEHSKKQGSVSRGETYEVLSREGKSWVQIRADGKTGYIKTPGKAVVVEKNRETVNQNVKLRRQVTEYALQFLGGEYRYGGVDPRKGVDCSGFTRYILRNMAGVDIPHSATGQAACGTEVSLEEMQPGDLIFYSSETGTINHVAMYIGSGQVVHASTEKTGIKTSPYDYREPVKVVSVLS